MYKLINYYQESAYIHDLEMYTNIMNMYNLSFMDIRELCAYLLIQELLILIIVKN